MWLPGWISLRGVTKPAVNRNPDRGVSGEVLCIVCYVRHLPFFWRSLSYLSLVASAHLVSKDGVQESGLPVLNENLLLEWLWRMYLPLGRYLAISSSQGFASY